MRSHDYVLSNGLSMMKRSEIKSYETWNAEELAEFISNQGLESYSHSIIEHKITGKLAPLLSEMDLKEMGITCIGDRLRFRLIVDNLKIKKRSLKRTQIVWEGRERIYYSEVTVSIFTTSLPGAQHIILSQHGAGIPLTSTSATYVKSTLFVAYSLQQQSLIGPILVGFTLFILIWFDMSA